MSFATGMEGAVQLLWWCRVDVKRYEAWYPNWFQWGYVTDGDEKIAWYILIRLPSYSMQVAWHRWDGPPTWHQRVLIFKEKVVSGDGVWAMIDWECQE